MKVVRENAFSNCNVPLLEVRFLVLYQTIFGLVSDEQIPQLIEEIVKFEKTNRRSTLRSISRYENIRATTILEDYSKIALFLAIEASQKKESTLLAKLLFRVYQEILKVKDADIAIQENQLHSVVSETILDFSYASGDFECISLRLHAILF